MLKYCNVTVCSVKILYCKESTKPLRFFFLFNGINTCEKYNKETGKMEEIIIRKLFIVFNYESSHILKDEKETPHCLS